MIRKDYVGLQSFKLLILAVIFKFNQNTHSTILEVAYNAV